jgi:hypothetical protein
MVGNIFIKDWRLTLPPLLLFFFCLGNRLSRGLLTCKQTHWASSNSPEQPPATCSFIVYLFGVSKIPATRYAIPSIPSSSPNSTSNMGIRVVCSSVLRRRRNIRDRETLFSSSLRQKPATWPSFSIVFRCSEEAATSRAASSSYVSSSPNSRQQQSLPDLSFFSVPPRRQRHERKSSKRFLVASRSEIQQHGRRYIVFLVLRRRQQHDPLRCHILAAE